MRMILQTPAARLLIPALLAAGWLAGLVIQRQGVVETGYMDVSQPLLLLGLGLCFVGGLVGRQLRPADPRARVGVLAGWAVLATILAGYWALTLLYGSLAGEASGETLASFLREAWLWIGVPVVLSGFLGWAGWLIAGLGSRD
jgi:hypothetical protein